MNDQTPSSTPGASLIPDSTSIITGTHFVFMALFAVLVVLGILWGVRLSRTRKRADKEIGRDNRDIEVTDRDPSAAAASESVEPSPNAAPDAASTTALRADTHRDDAATSEAPAIKNEPIAAASTSDATPARDADAGGAPKPAAATGAIPVTRLKGLGPKVAARLAELGVTDAAQIAALSDADAAALDAQLGAFAGRMARDRWIEQARFLANGDRAGFEAVFGKL